MTHTPKCPERDRECQTGSFAFLSGFFITFSVLHDLCHKISHGLRRPILLLPGGVGVGTQGEARVVVPQHAADRFHIYAVLEGQGRECVPALRLSKSFRGVSPPSRGGTSLQSPMRGTCVIASDKM